MTSKRSVFSDLNQIVVLLIEYLLQQFQRIDTVIKESKQDEPDKKMQAR